MTVISSDTCVTKGEELMQADLINYGLIPEFVGRFPVICSLQVRLIYLNI